MTAREDHGSTTEHDAALWEAHRGQADDPDDRPTLAEATRDEYDGDYGEGPQEPRREVEPEPRPCPHCGRTHRQGDTT